MQYRYWLIILSLFTHLSFADVPAPHNTLVKTVHLAVCQSMLYSSMRDRLETATEISQGDYNALKDFNAEIAEMSDEEYRMFMAKEIGKLVGCHPVVSNIVDYAIPGKNYWKPVEHATAPVKFVDRVVTYGVWSYTYLYRKLVKRIDAYKAQLSSNMALSIEQREKISRSLKIAQKQAAELRVMLGKNGINLEEIIRSVPDYETVQSTSKDSDYDISHAQAGYSDEDAIRSVIWVYTLIGNEFTVYGVETVEVLLQSDPSAVLNLCYDRYTPDVPVIARLISSGRYKEKIIKNLLDGDVKQLNEQYIKASNTIPENGFFFTESVHSSLAKFKPSAKAVDTCLALSDEYSDDADETLSSILVSSDYENVDLQQDAWVDLLTALTLKHIVIDKL